MKADWDDIDSWTQCLIIGYEHVRQFEEAEEFAAMIKTRMPL